MTSCEERFLLAPDRRAVRAARLHVRGFDELPQDAGATAELVVSELVANSLLHVRMDPQDRIELTLRRESERVVVEVADGGAFSRRPGSKAGWGFKILDAVCEGWNAQNGCVSASIAIPRSPGGEGSHRSLRLPLSRTRS